MEKLVNALKKLEYLTESDKKELLDLGKFNNHLFYQKLIFLFSLKTKALNYHYNWYIRGPYSPELTRDLFAIEELLHKNRPYIDTIILRNVNNGIVDDGIESIKTLESLLQQKFNREWVSEDLEILASIAFIERYTYDKCKGSKEETIKEFNDRKYELKDKPIERYWDILHTAGYV